MLNDAIDFSAVRRVLLIKLRHHGDVLLTSPVLTALNEFAPHVEIDALVYADTAPMLSGHPALSRLFTVPRRGRLKGWGRWKAEWTLLKALRSRRYDGVIHLTESRRGAWLVRALKPSWSVAPWGDFGRFFKRSFTHRYPVIGGNRRHTVEIHLDALRRLGVRMARSYPLHIAIPDDDRKNAAQKRHALGVETPYILIHPTSRWMFKAWPVEHMAALIESLRSDDVTVLLTAAPDTEELHYIERVQARLSSPVPSLAGLLSLKELAALIDDAHLFFGMDSVPMHLAAACQTPTVALFGPSGEIEWSPWLVLNRVLTSAHTCRPCGRDGCGGSRVSDCLEAISPCSVRAAIDEMLSEVLKGKES